MTPEELKQVELTKPPVDNRPPKEQAENLLKQLPPMMNALADRLEKAKDEEEAKAMATEYFKATIGNYKKLDTLNLPQKEKEEVITKYGGDIEKAQKRIFAAGKKYSEALAISMDGPIHELDIPAGEAEPKQLYAWSGSLDQNPKLPNIRKRDY